MYSSLQLKFFMIKRNTIILYRRHGNLRKGLNVKTPFETLQKPVVSEAEP